MPEGSVLVLPLDEPSVMCSAQAENHSRRVMGRRGCTQKKRLIEKEGERGRGGEVDLSLHSIGTYEYIKWPCNPGGDESGRCV